MSISSLQNDIAGYYAQFSWLTALMVLGAYIVLDILYAYYTIAVSRLLPARAATTGSIMYFLLAVGVVNYSHNPLYLGSVVVGSWIGTYAVVEFERRKKKTAGEKATQESHT